MTKEEPSFVKLLSELIEAVKHASGSAGHLIHHLQHPGFIVLRDTLDLVVEGLAGSVDQAISRPIVRSK